jgi:hypothetical protein
MVWNQHILPSYLVVNLLESFTDPDIVTVTAWTFEP